MNGLFIALEGPDCGGKNTQVVKLAEWLRSEGVAVTVGEEPTDEKTPIGKQIREILQKKRLNPGPFELQRMFVLDRAQDILCFIEPALERGDVCIWERYALSTIAYGMLEDGFHHYYSLHKEVVGPFMRWPDLTIVIDISPREAIRRLSTRDGNPEAELSRK